MSIFSLGKTDFIQASIAIVQLFPGEICQTYYIPADNKFQTKGKLRDAYNNYRTSLAKLNQITRRVRRKPLEPADPNTLLSNISNKNIDKEKDLEFLHKFVEPRESICKAWQSTFEQRFNILESSVSTLEYIETFPALVQPKGHELVSLFFLFFIFHYLYKDSKSIKQKFSSGISSGIRECLQILDIIRVLNQSI